MATLTAIAPLTDHRTTGLSDDDATQIFDLMLRTREIDERMWALNRQGKVPFVVPCRGQEAAQVGAAWALDPTKDWLFPHYRDLGLAQWFGFDVNELFLMFFAKGTDIISNGRQMTHHFGSQARHVASISAPLGSLAALHKLPVIFFCENNGYAISVPMSRQSPVPNVADRAAAFGFPGVIVDGTDPFATYVAVRDARARGLRGEGPTLIEAKMYRLLPHTSDDNDMTYRTREEVRQAEEGEPLKRIVAYMQERGLASAEEIAARRARIREEIAVAVVAAQAAPDPDPATIADRVYAPVER
ncbi:MAG: thiamine pyrophosphate-dependent dehydrogenase E1 component subunit alpha [Thermomicrobia bacterium]|nr:thiamine pyrophosphate-dependent dehydrogenase E1 component subunit alpha [Thermomicrobia bacterium]